MPQRGIDREAKKLFVETVVKLKTTEEIEEFFKDIFSSTEIKEFSRRLLAAKMLLDGTTFREITKEMGMSAGTINKVYFKTRGSPLLHNVFKK